MSDSGEIQTVTVGAKVIGANGATIGVVREMYPHYLLVHEDGQHGDFDVPVHAIVGIEDGTLYVSVNRESVTAVNDEETAHRLIPGDG